MGSTGRLLSVNTAAFRDIMAKCAGFQKTAIETMFEGDGEDDKK